ncbi:DUF2778 domain-containing protein [Burkholderia sp. Ax-1724]|uniref:DUF2778 domain-containing protein n=1 Tax=Burkholderia sp. Ax-1724 TaxID=2608336 RepID=UPI00141D7927|nr:DUF2778 domain-containing protein [Burkholderia sp. Ax-1724]NIF52044.1 DUF2778 domain-containing protein [Burkholderia sp. Ax-1724]
MSVFCTFALNNRETSGLYCLGLGMIEAYSGHGKGRDNPNAVSIPMTGAIPPGTYFIVDRQSGGRLGWLHDLSDTYLGSTDRTKWFMLWNAHGGDTTMIDGIRRGNFRLHAEGPMRESDGCITVKNGNDFERLQRYIRSHKPNIAIPGSDHLKAYGRLEVR